MMTRSTVTITAFALVSAILAVGIMIAVGSAAYALGGPGGSGRRGYPTHPPLHRLKPQPNHQARPRSRSQLESRLHGQTLPSWPRSSHNPIVVSRRGRY
jgi:hypothetical protein